LPSKLIADLIHPAGTEPSRRKIGIWNIMGWLYVRQKRPNPVWYEYEKGTSYHQEVFKGVKTLWYNPDFYGPWFVW